MRRFAPRASGVRPLLDQKPSLDMAGGQRRRWNMAAPNGPEPPSPRATAKLQGPPVENERERLNRNFAELIQEIRVAEAGVQILFAFLLTLPFTNRFGQMTGRDICAY